MVLAHLANAYRFCGDLHSVKGALTQGKGPLWDVGVDDEYEGVLEEAISPFLALCLTAPESIA